MNALESLRHHSMKNATTVRSSNEFSARAMQLLIERLAEHGFNNMLLIQPMMNVNDTNFNIDELLSSTSAIESVLSNGKVYNTCSLAVRAKRVDDTKSLDDWYLFPVVIATRGDDFTFSFNDLDELSYLDKKSPFDHEMANIVIDKFNRLMLLDGWANVTIAHT